MHHESAKYMRWLAGKLWLLAPVQGRVVAFLDALEDYPVRESMSLNGAGINHRSLKAMKAQRQVDLHGLFDHTIGN